MTWGGIGTATRAACDRDSKLKNLAWKRLVVDAAGALYAAAPRLGASAGAAATATGAAGTGARAPRREFRLICDDREPRIAAPCGVYRVEADEMR